MSDPSDGASLRPDDTVRLWDVATGRQIGNAMTAGGQGNSAGAVAFNPNGKILASASDDGTVKLWNTATHRQIGLTMTASSGRGTGSGANGVAFSRSGLILATARGDGTIRLWDVSTQRQIGPAITVPGGADTVAYDPSAMILAALSSTDVQLWDVAFPRNLVRAVCSIADGSLTRKQWAYYVKVVPYIAGC